MVFTFRLLTTKQPLPVKEKKNDSHNNNDDDDEESGGDEIFVKYEPVKKKREKNE